VFVDEDVYNTLYTACKTGNVSALKQILHDLKLQSISTETALDAAVAGEFPDDRQETFPLLTGKVSAGISRLLCHRSRNNLTTLLHVASQSSHMAVIRLLLLHGADPAIKYAALYFIYFIAFISCCLHKLNSNS